MLADRYNLSFYISWKMERKVHPVFKTLSKKTTDLIETQLDVKLERPLFSKKMSPDLGNPVIEQLRLLLENFKHEDECIKVHMREPFGVENFAIEDRGNVCVGQHRLTFSIFNKNSQTSAENYGRVLPLLLKKIMKIKIETKEVILTIIDYRTKGQIKMNDDAWPKSGSTEF